jgi:hypothetical protein
VASTFQFSPLRTTQTVMSEMGTRLYSEKGYRWCSGTAELMPAPLQSHLCSLLRYIWGLTGALVGLSIVLLVATCSASTTNNRYDGEAWMCRL